MENSWVLDLLYSSRVLILPQMLWLTGPTVAEPLLQITIGDSITRGVRPDVRLEETFPALVQKALIQQGISIEIINTGIGGDTVDALKNCKPG